MARMTRPAMSRPMPIGPSAGSVMDPDARTDTGAAPLAFMITSVQSPATTGHVKVAGDPCALATQNVVSQAVSAASFRARFPFSSPRANSPERSDRPGHQSRYRATSAARPIPTEDVTVRAVPRDRDTHGRGETAAGRERFAQVEGLEHERVPAAVPLRLRQCERAVRPHEHHDGDATDRHEQTEQDQRYPTRASTRASCEPSSHGEDGPHVDPGIPSE